jgi:hypothetical protein
MRYVRGLSDRALRLWVEESLPQRLLLPILNCIPEDPYALDMQLREGGVLQVYHGNTSILRITANEAGSTVRLQFDTYDSVVDTSFPSLKRNWKIDEVVELSMSLRQILPMLVARTNPTYYRNEKEGFLENQLCYIYGRSWTPEREWLVVDRQAVIGFASNADRKRFYEPIVKKHIGACQLIFEKQDRRWAQPKSIGNELDLLLVSQQRAVVCMELKHASNNAGVYYGPFQAAVYRDAFLAAMNSIVTEIERLARQKIALGLLPTAAAKMLPMVKPTVVRAILAVVGRPSKEVERRLRMCLECCGNIEYRSFKLDSERMLLE